MIKLCMSLLSLIGKKLDHLLVSQDPSNYRDAPTEGIRRVLEIVLNEKIPRGETLKTDKIGTPA